MQTSACHESGSVQRRFLAVILLCLALAGLAVIFINRPQSKLPPPEHIATPIEVSRTNLILEAGLLRLSTNAPPFTGFMVEHYIDGSLRSRSAVTNGVLQGLSQGWFTNGQMQVSENFKHGISHGVRTKWYADGTKQSEAGIVDGKLQGTFRKWHPNGALAEQVEFVADQPEGVSVAYFPSGYLKARVVMKEGKAVEQTFWKDGEKKE